MIGPEKERKLESLFRVIPENSLYALHRALSADIDGPLDQKILSLIEKSAATRNIALDPGDAEASSEDVTPTVPSPQPVEDPEPELRAAKSPRPAPPPAARAVMAEASEAVSAIGLDDIAADDIAADDPAADDAADDIDASAESLDNADDDEPRDAVAERAADEAPLVLDDAADLPGAALVDAPEEPVSAPREPVPFVPPRNAMHAFFLPFESLIIDPPRYAARIGGYLCSTSLPAIWRMLNEEASGSVIRDAWMRAELDRGVRDEDFYQQITGQMHAAARVVVDDIRTRAGDNTGMRRNLHARLGGDAGFGDFAELHKMLPIIQRFQTEFAQIRPLVDVFTPARAEQIASRILETARDGGPLAGYLQLAVLSNLDSPWQGLHLHHALVEAAGEEDKRPSIIAGHLLHILEAQLSWLEERLETEAGDPAVLDPFIGFSELLAGMADNEALLVDTRLKSQLARLVKAGSGMIDDLIETAAATLEKALPVRTSGDSGQERPDLKRLATGPEAARKMAAGRDAAAFLAAGPSLAGFYDREETWAALAEETGAILTQYLADTERTLAGLPGETRARLSKVTEFLADLAEQLGMDEAAHRVRESAAETAEVA